MSNNLKDRDKKPSKTAFFDSFKDWIAIAVSVFGIVAFYKTCAHDGELKDLNFELRSLGYQPRLKLAESPQISTIRVDTLSVKLREHPKKHSGEVTDPHTVDIKFELTVTSKIKITNVAESSLGKIIVLMSTDTIPTVKDFVTGRFLPDSIKYNLEEWSKLQNTHVLPGDTVEVSTTTKIRYISNKTYVLHFILIYQNELGNLYHTHTLVPYELKPLMFQPKVTMKVNVLEQALYKIVKDLISSNKFMNPVTPASYYETYNRKDTELARSHLNTLIPGIGL